MVLSNDFDDFLLAATTGEEMNVDYSDHASLQANLTRFNLEIDSIVERHGLSETGKAIWFFYGGGGITHEVLDESVQAGITKFYESLKTLYEGFARHCSDRYSHSDEDGNPFATGCYMLWDMDSGLEYLSFRRADLIEHATELVDFGLAHRHAAVQESFLHCLGHLQYRLPEFVDPRLELFLRRTDISDDIREYAKQCQTGAIQ